MPEGDTVYLAAKRLNEAFAGRLLTASDFRIAPLATLDLAGLHVREVCPRGKHLLFRFDDDTTLHTHFRMDGTWHLYRSQDTWRGGPSHTIRIVLRTADRVAVGYRLHDISLVRTCDEHTLVGHLGPDICADEWDQERAIERLRANGGRSIAAALVDQRIIAGIGNIYRCESMFLTGLAPQTKVADIDDGRLREVVSTARTLMLRNRDRASQSTTGDERRAHYVYGRRRASCPRCGSTIATTSAADTEPDRPVPESRGRGNEQTIFWCPTCQPRVGTGPQS